MLYHAFTQTAYKMGFTHNKYGERVYASQTEFRCLFKEITGYDRINKMEFENCDSVIWTAPGNDLEQGNLLKIDNELYLIDKIRLARRLGSNIVEFVKCGLIRQAESIS
jgi:hypothetical protein